MTWQPGDPLHPVVDGVTRPMFEVIPDEAASWARARWPEPLPHHDLTEIASIPWPWDDGEGS